MFKLLKELARPPEPLSSHRSSIRSGDRGRSTSPSPGHLTPRIGVTSPQTTAPSSPYHGHRRTGSSVAPQKEFEEKDEDAKKVVELLKQLKREAEGEVDVMRYVEAFSQLLSFPNRPPSKIAFVRHHGLDLLIAAFGSGLAWKACDGEEGEVLEVQRKEALRLGFEVLAWALSERECLIAFQRSGGYLRLLPAIRKLSPPVPASNGSLGGDNEASGSNRGLNSSLIPDPYILAQLLAHVFNSNYTILHSLPQHLQQTTDDQIEKQSAFGELVLSHGAALPLLWAYIWGFQDANPKATLKGKEKVRAQDEMSAAYGVFEGSDLGRIHLISVVFHMLLSAAQASAANLFVLANYLPQLAPFLITRLFGPEAKRTYEVTFPGRPDWFEPDVHQGVLPDWSPPPTSLRPVYLAVLRKILEAGVTQHITWRLFTAVRKPPKKLTRTGALSPIGEDTRSRSSTITNEGEDSHSGKKRPRPRNLTIPISEPIEPERLDPEVLDLIRHAMRARWPPSFVFRGGDGGRSGGLELRDLGRKWVDPAKGFSFSSWIYISRLNHPITLISVSQADAAQPFFEVRILENSQIALIIGSNSTGEDGKLEAPIEIVCSAPDALIPHDQWVQFAVLCRKPKGGAIAEAKIFVNGVRVGSMKLGFPEAATPADPPAGSSVKVVSAPISVNIGRAASVGDGLEGASAVGRAEENEWLLGRTMLLEDAIAEDLVLLLFHLGPRYHGNLQEPLNKFLTYEAGTSINIYLSSLGQEASEKRLFTMPSTSILVKAIRQGQAIPEDSIMLSVSAQDVFPTSRDVSPDRCVNAAVSNVHRARHSKTGTVVIRGDVQPFSTVLLDDSLSAVGGGVVLLKLIDLSQSSEELATALSILRETIKDSCRASEEMERIRGYELLSAILRPKMREMFDPSCAKIVLNMLGIHADKATNAAVHNSDAYRALGLELELWAPASLGVCSLYLQHFEYLLAASKHARYNLLRTFQKSGIVKKILYALRAHLFDQTVVPMVIDTLKLVLATRWSAEDAIKPVFSYLVSALCQANGSFIVTNPTEPPPSQYAASLILAMMAELTANQPRLVKLNRSVALHRLLVIFISSNSAYYVILPCLDILSLCLKTNGLESFHRSFEGEGGFALLATSLSSIWRADVQAKVFGMMVDESEEKAGPACQSLISTVMAALDWLLQNSSDDEGNARPSAGRSRSGTITSVASIAMSPNPTTSSSAPSTSGPDSRLTGLLNQMTESYDTSAAFRKALSARKVESMLPPFVDFAAVASSSNQTDAVKEQRDAAAAWLAILVEKGKFTPTLASQLKLVLEQLRFASPSPSIASSSYAMSSTPSRSSYFRSSLSGGIQASPLSSTPTTPVAALPRRRPSNDSISSFTKSRPILDKRNPLKRMLTGESVLEGGKDKNAAWKLIIISTDSQAHSKMTLERKEHWKRLSESDWPRLVASVGAENGLWPLDDLPVTWRLDGSEGPLRMRNRLERINAIPEQGMARTRAKVKDAIPSVDELSSAVSRVNVAPWEDPFSLALGQAAPIAEETSGSEATPAGPEPTADPMAPENAAEDEDGNPDVEEDKDDKMRRIQRTLEAGDAVEEAHNIVRIVGVDACPGLLIMGKRNLYLVDGLVQTPNGEIIDAKDAPRDALTIPSGTLVELDSLDQQSHRWSYNEIVENTRREFLFRDVALELYFSDKRNFLIVFRDKRERQWVCNKLNSKSDQPGGASRSVIGTLVLDAVGKADRNEQHLAAMTVKWQNREISNFAYLQLLNQYANRTPNDVTQYPVFPWVVADYTSTALDLEKASSFRTLEYPMGGLTPARREAAAERYSATEGVGEKPFHYGTHYSSSMIVCGFMIRLSPFTEVFLALQGGNFDLADRLFSSIPRSWESASSDNRGDVRELIPEFFYSSAFLLNINKHDFGRKQVGEEVNNVVLPPWALDDPLLFVHRHREALESDYVSRHLPQWIDLTFGYKQRDQASFNCFHPLSYRGAVDLDNMQDESEKAASTAIIHNFGQTPQQIFQRPHHHRFTLGKTQLPVGHRFGVAENWQLLIRSIVPISETFMPIDSISDPFSVEARPMPQQRYRLAVPNSTLAIHWGFTDGSLRIYWSDTSPRLMQVIEGIFPVHAIMAGPTLVVTADAIGVLTAWRLHIKGYGARKGEAALHREGTLRGHTSAVTCMAACPAWSLLISGAEDGTAIVWDTNRLRYIRTLQTPLREPIRFIGTYDADAHICLATRKNLYMFSLNGHPIASVSIDEDFRFPLLQFDDDEGHDEAPESAEEFTGGISFLNREFLNFGPLFVVGVGSEVALYRCTPGVRHFEFEEDVKPWRLVAQGRLHRSDDHQGGDCSMVRFIGEKLYAAFEPAEPGGKHSLYQWSLPEGDARQVADSVAPNCMAEQCSRHFGLLEPRRHCGGCGGAFCGTHAVHVENFNMRYCLSCRDQLAYADEIGVLKKKRDSIMPSPRSRRASLAPSRNGSRPGSRRGSVAATVPGQAALVAEHERRKREATVG